MRFFLSCHGASLYGGERVLLALAQGLRSRGHEVTLEIPHDGPAVAIARQVAGVDVLLSRRPRLPRNSIEGAHYLAGAPAAAWRLRRAIRSGEFDVVWVNSLFNPVAGVAARAAGAAVVWHLHERNFRGIAGRAAGWWIGRCCNLAVAISRFVADSFDAAGLGGRIRVLPNALLAPVPVADPRPAAEGFVIGYVGQLEPRKRPVDVLTALSLLPDMRAVLVGDGKARESVVSAIRHNGLDGRVTLAGFQQDVGPYLLGCDCVVIPSRDEPFGLIALEAMAAGRPVIAARSGALPEVLGDAALYYPLGDASALAQCVRRLRLEPSLGGTLRARGLRRVREYSMERMLSGVEAVALEAIELRRSGMDHGGRKR